jgi:hypothetical protein
VTFLILDICRRFPINLFGTCAVMFNDTHDLVVLVEFRHGYQQLRELFGRLARQFSMGARRMARRRPRRPAGGSSARCRRVTGTVAACRYLCGDSPCESPLERGQSLDWLLKLTEVVDSPVSSL